MTMMINKMFLNSILYCCLPFVQFYVMQQSLALELYNLLINHCVIIIIVCCKLKHNYSIAIALNRDMGIGCLSM